MNMIVTTFGGTLGVIRVIRGFFGGPLMSEQNLIGINLILVEILESGSKQWTDQTSSYETEFHGNKPD